jgi:precorrin-6A synthase
VTRRIHVIGIGAGDPDYVTAQAIEALNDTQVFFAMDKGDTKDDLVALRRQICERFIGGPGYRFVELPDPPRDKDGEYRQAVAEWHAARARIWAEAFESELEDGATGAFLAWGDPSLYDSTLRILDILAQDGFRFARRIVPGITSLQVLAARHGIALNTVGGPVHVTTGRRLREAVPDADSIAVMLDADCAFRHLPPDAFAIYWGAYLGMPNEVVIAGPLDEVADRIAEVRAQARAANGWIMDTYLLRRRRS